MRAPVRQKATGVGDAVAEYLDNEDEAWRTEARKTLGKLPLPRTSDLCAVATPPARTWSALSR